MELARREKIAGIKPDEDLDIFMKVCDVFRFISFCYRVECQIYIK